MFKLCWSSLFMPTITNSKNLHCAISSVTILYSVDNRSMQQINFKSLQTCNSRILEPRWRFFKSLINVHQWPSYPLYFRWLKHSSLSDESWMLWVASCNCWHWTTWDEKKKHWELGLGNQPLWDARCEPLHEFKVLLDDEHLAVHFACRYSQGLHVTSWFWWCLAARH